MSDTLDVGTLVGYLKVDDTKWSFKAAEAEFQRFAKTVQDDLDKITGKWESTAKAAEASSKTQVDALKKLADATTAATGSTDKAAEATDKAADAETALAAALDDVGDKQDKAAESTDKLADAQDKLGDAAEKAGEKLAISVEKGLKKTGDDAEKAGIDTGRRFTFGASTALLGAKVLLTPAATTLGVTAGAAIGGGLVTGFGLGVAGIGIASAANSEAVSRDWLNLSAYIASRSAVISKPWETELAKIASQGRQTWDRMESSLAQAQARMAPAASRFTGELGRGLTAFERQLPSISRATAAVLDDLGDRLPGVLTEISDDLGELADQLAENPESLGRAIEAFGELAEVAINVLSALNQVQSFMAGFWGGVGDFMSAAHLDFWNLFADDASKVPPPLDEVALSLEQTAHAQEMAKAAAEGHAQALADLSGEARDLAGADLALREALAGQVEAQKAAAEATKKHGVNSAEAADAARGYERSLLAVYDAAEAKSEAENAGLLPAQRSKQAAFDATEAILGLALAAGKNAPPELARLAESLAAAQEDAIAATRATGEFGTKVLTLPNGKTIAIAVDDKGSPVIDAVTNALALFDSRTYTAKLRIVTEGRVPTGPWAAAGGAMAHFARGGNIAAGQIGEVAEEGPELLSSGGRQYLLMGTQPGVITPTDQLAAGALTGGRGTGGGSGPAEVRVTIDGRGVDDVIWRYLQDRIRIDHGGNVQVSLGTRQSA